MPDERAEYLTVPRVVSVYKTGLELAKRVDCRSVLDVNAMWRETYSRESMQAQASNDTRKV